MSEQLNIVDTKDRGVGAIGVLSLVAVSALAGAGAMYAWGPSRDEHVDPTMQELFHQANQECANEKVAEVSVTPERIAQAASLQELSDTVNGDLKNAIQTCVFDETGIPTGTVGFDVLSPTIKLSIDAKPVAVTEGN